MLSPGEDDFFPCLGVHEVVAHVVFIGVLVGAAFDANFVHFHAGVPGFVEDTTGFYIFEFRADEGGTLAGLYVKEFHDEVVFAVDIEAHTVFEISCSCHIIY